MSASLCASGVRPRNSPFSSTDESGGFLLRIYRFESGKGVLSSWRNWIAQFFPKEPVESSNLSEDICTYLNSYRRERDSLGTGRRAWCSRTKSLAGFEPREAAKGRQPAVEAWEWTSVHYALVVMRVHTTL